MFTVVTVNGSVSVTRFTSVTDALHEYLNAKSNGHEVHIFGDEIQASALMADLENSPPATAADETKKSSNQTRKTFEWNKYRSLILSNKTLDAISKEIGCSKASIVKQRKIMLASADQ